jgi:hypothetical protein
VRAATALRGDDHLELAQSEARYRQQADCSIRQ